MERATTSLCIDNQEHKYQVLSGSEQSIFCSRCGHIGVHPGFLDAGIILLWSGSIENIPKCFTLCNGENGTPDLRDKFIVGSGKTFNVGSTGGSTQVTLSLNNLPEHAHNRHSQGVKEHPIIEHVLKKNESTQFGIRHEQMSGSSYGNEIKTVKAIPYYATQTGTAGAANPHPIDIRPPYYSLAFIMRVKMT